MSDLTADELTLMQEASFVSGPLRHLCKAAVAEVTRRRAEQAEQAAGRERVEEVVHEIVAEELAKTRRLDERFLVAIARRVADRLSVPVLSEKDVASAMAIRFELLEYGMSAGTGKHDSRLMDRCVDLLDRLIAEGKP